MQSSINRFETAFGKWVVRHRWWIIVATIFATLSTFHGIQFLKVNMDNRVFFSKDNPQLQALEAFENTYDQANNVFFIIAPKDSNVFTRSNLAAVVELTEVSWQIPHSNRVNSITNFQHTSVKDDELIVDDLVQNTEILSDDEIEQIKDIAISRPLLLNNLISPSGDVPGIIVNILLPGKSDNEVVQVTNFARDLVAHFERKYPDIDIYLTGTVPLDVTFGEAGQNDMSVLVPLMLLTLVVIVELSLRSFKGELWLCLQ